MRLSLIILTITLGFVAAPVHHAHADRHLLPKLGDRQYVTDPDSAVGSIDIRSLKSESPASGVVMRDPDLSPVSKKVSPKPKAQTKKARPKSKLKVTKKVEAGTSVLRFQTKQVTGRKTTPRVRFEVPRLAVPRTDQPFPSGNINASLSQLGQDDQDL